MARTGVLVFALVIGFVLTGSSILMAQGRGGQTPLADLKIEYPGPRSTDKATFTIDSQTDVKVDLNLPVLSGTNRAWVGLINFVTREEVWGMMVNPEGGPMHVTESRTLTPGTYRLIYEFAGEKSTTPRAEWSGTLTVQK